VKWIRNETNNGCAVAACAMLLNQSFRDTAAQMRAAGVYSGKSGVGLQDTISVLQERGFDTYIRERTARPFAEVHLGAVAASPLDPESSHAVVVLGDGSVWDPNAPGYRRLADYARVHMLVGLVPREGRPAELALQGYFQPSEPGVTPRSAARLVP
jgi:hypothetical protein